MTERAEVGARTPGPWAVHGDFPDIIVPQGHVNRSVGGSIHEADDRDRYANPIAIAQRNKYSGFAHEISRDEQRANAAFIVKACNENADLHATVAALRKALEDLDAHWTEDFPNGPDTLILHGSTRSVWRNVRAALALRDPAGKET